MRNLYELTPTENKICLYWINNFSYTEIAERLGIKGTTVRTHIAHIYEKKGIHSKEQLIKQLREENF